MRLTNYIATLGILSLSVPLAAFADDSQEIREISLRPPAQSIQAADTSAGCGDTEHGNLRGCSATTPVPTQKKQLSLSAQPVKKQRSSVSAQKTAKPLSAISLLEGKPALSGSTAKLQPGEILEPPVVVLPETTTTVKLSTSDLNRVICPTDIKDALTSDEKGLQISITGKDAFLKYKVAKQSDGTLNYSSTPTEVFIVCGGQTYSMIAFPGRMPSQTIKLSSGREDKIKENQALYSGLPFEKRVMRAIKDVFTDSIPESYSVTNRNVVDTTWKGLVITHRRDVEIEGEGMTIKEYRITLAPNEQSPASLLEKMFLRTEFTLNPVAAALDKHTLKVGEAVRLFIAEQKPDKPLGNSGFMLPVVDSVPSLKQTVKEKASLPSGIKLPPMGKM